MCYIITDGTRYIRTSGGIHSVYTFGEATKFEEWKANNVFSAIPQYLKDYGLIIKHIGSEKEEENSITEIDKKQMKNIDKFFSSWNELNNNLMAYQCASKGIEYKDINDPMVQKYWKSLKKYEREVIINKFGVGNEDELFELLSIN